MLTARELRDEQLVRTLLIALRQEAFGDVYEPESAETCWNILVDFIRPAADRGGSVNIELGVECEPPLHYAELFLVGGLLLAINAEHYFISDDDECRWAAANMTLYADRCYEFWNCVRGDTKCRNPDARALRVNERNKKFEEHLLKIKFRERSREDGARGADFRHARNRERARQLKEAWASGRYQNRDQCARELCSGLGLTFKAARKHLIGTPEPSVAVLPSRG